MAAKPPGFPDEYFGHFWCDIALPQRTCDEPPHHSICLDASQVFLEKNELLFNIGDGHVAEHFWIVAEHDMKAGYVHNIQCQPRVRLRLRDGIRARGYGGTAYLLPDDEPRERQKWLASHVPGSAADASAVRYFGTDLLTVRTDLDG